MRKLVYLLSAIILFCFVTSTFAQELHLTTFDAKSVEQVKKGDNFWLEKAFSGDRATNPDQTVSKSNKVSKFPIMTPFLLVAKPSGNATEVVWNISSKNVTVVSAPQGSTFESSSHVRTPVLKQSQSLNVENPVIIKEGCPELKSDWERIAKREKDNFTHNILYDGDFRSYCVDKNISIPVGSAFILVVATVEDYVHFTAVSYTNGDVDKNSSVVGHVQFIPTVSVSGGCEYELFVSGAPKKSPMILPQDGNKIAYEIKIANNKNYSALDLSQAVLKFESVGNWWNEGTTYMSLASFGKLERGKEITINIDKSINESALPEGIGVAKAKVTLLYPTVKPGSGKLAEIDLTYTLTKEVKVKCLAGIGTYIDGSEELTIFNTATEECAVLEIVNPAVSPNRLEAGKSAGYDARGQKEVNISYRLFDNDKPVGPFKLRIVK